MGFSQVVQEKALLASGRCCCICHKFCGTKINLHHIIQSADGGDDSFENCIPLCLDCHEDMDKPDPRHSTGKHYSSNELIMHRDNWYAKVQNGNADTNAPVCEEDKELFKQIRTFFTDELCDTLKSCDFGGVFPYSLFSDLDKVYRISDNPDNEFIDAELETMRVNMFNIIRDFKNYLAANTFGRLIGGKMYQVPRLWLLKEGEIRPERNRHDDGWYFDDEGLEYEKPEDENDIFTLYANRYQAEANKLNEYAEQLWNAYNEFARRGRRIVLR